MFEALLADYGRVSDAGHPYALTCRHNLAVAYRSAGYLDRAVAEFEAALAGRERVLGPDHPHTEITRGNLAAAYEALHQEGPDKRRKER